VVLVEPVRELVDARGDLIEVHRLLTSIAFDDVHRHRVACGGDFDGRSARGVVPRANNVFRFSFAFEKKMDWYRFPHHSVQRSVPVVHVHVLYVCNRSSPVECTCTAVQRTVHQGITY
jgi:hypothetical protein